MTYAETLHYIFHKLPMFSRMGSAAYKKDLHNIRALCHHLGNPQNRLKCIHVAGTNGKGSVSHMLAAIFQRCGYKTGLYTSPHLYDFRERIKVNGTPIPETAVNGFVERLQPLIEEIEPSFFEITVAMAFEFFAAQETDVAIIEVGLGGRLDSTNIITPELSVITNIGWDHMNLLGHSLQEIAAEKAGIIKEDIPVVIGETIPESKEIFRQTAAAKNAPVFWAEAGMEIMDYDLQPLSLQAVYRRKNDGQTITVESDLQGIYQVQNIRTVLTATSVLQNNGWRLADNEILTALKSVKGLTGLGGRWEVIQQQPTIVLEVAHNEAGVRQLLRHLQELAFPVLHVVLGMVKDKEVEKVLQLLPPSGRYYFTEAAIPRALPARELQEKAAAAALKGAVYRDVNEAIGAALERAGPDDIIVVCGSIFLVSEVDKSQYRSSPNRSSA